MAKSQKLSVQTLKKLGAERLAELLLDSSEDDKLLQRRLNLETLGLKSPSEMARAVRRRIGTIRRAKSFLDWDKENELAKDLKNHLEAIDSRVVRTDPSLALELFWEFLDISNSVLGRVRGCANWVFVEAMEMLADHAESGTIDVSGSVENIVHCLEQNGYGQFDNLIKKVGPSLGDVGLDELKQEFHARLLHVDPKKPSSWFELDKIKTALRDIADIQEDVDAYVALFDEEARTHPRIASQIADRLNQARRFDEAVVILERSKEERLDQDWFDSYITALDELGRSQEAQAARWMCFKDNFSRQHLRDFLKRLDEVAAFDKEEEALEFVVNHEQTTYALPFLLEWPDRRRAAILVLNRAQEFDGYYYQEISHAAELLANHSPLASTVLLRSMIDYALDTRTTKRYKHAARHLGECSQLATRITDYGDVESHDSYFNGLKTKHGRKISFWVHAPGFSDGSEP